MYLKLRLPQLKAIIEEPITKLSLRYYGPFPIIARLGKVAYKLQLPENSHIHPVFHMSLLKKYVGGQPVSLKLPTRNSSEEPTLEPEAILDRRVIYQQGAPLIQVLVKWSQLPMDDNAWEYLPNLLKQFPRVASLLCIS